MARVVRKEIRKRGFFGWLFLIIFLLFNALMLAWIIGYWVNIGQLVQTSDAERAGAAIGATIGTGLILFVWVAGTVILGLLALLTRGRKYYVEETFE